MRIIKQTKGINEMKTPLVTREGYEKLKQELN
ncbi:transcription elongation factor GreB, partial [Escherichia coli]